jgi:TRIAD3 protein (E3 ubiquitin-protein ligase RNF216)
MTEVIEILSDGDEDFIRPRPSARQGFGSASEVIDISSEPPEESSSLDLDQVTAQVLEIVPDVALDYLEDMIVKLLEKSDPSNFVERVLHSLLENSSYPKNEQTKGKKRKRESSEEEGPATKVPRQDVDYASNDRPYKGGPHYQQLALNQLFTDFPYIPTSYIKGALRKNSSLYGPTHLQLLTEQSSSSPPFRLKSAQTKVAGKSTANDDEYLAERAWLEHHLEAIAQSKEQSMTQIVEREEDFECACCFTSYSFVSHRRCRLKHEVI